MTPSVSEAFVHTWVYLRLSDVSHLPCLFRWSTASSAEHFLAMNGLLCTNDKGTLASHFGPAYLHSDAASFGCVWNLFYRAGQLRLCYRLLLSSETVVLHVGVMTASELDNNSFRRGLAGGESLSILVMLCSGNLFGDGGGICFTHTGVLGCVANARPCLQRKRILRLP